MAKELIYSVEEAADLLRTTVTTVKALIIDNQLQSVKIGDQRVIRRSDLEEFVEKLRAEVVRNV